MSNWLESFALVNLPSHLLYHCSAIFKAAKNKRGKEYLLKLGKAFAAKHGHTAPLHKSFGLDFIESYPGFEALFIQLWPCKWLSCPPIYLAAIRKPDASFCRLYRLNYYDSGQLYLSEISLNESACIPQTLPSYQEATALIFSYTLGTRCFQKDIMEKAPQISSFQIKD